MKHAYAINLNQRNKRERERESATKFHEKVIPFKLEELFPGMLFCRGTFSSIFKAGESCPAAKPNLATFENSILSPATGGLDDIEEEIPRAKQKKSRGHK
jgi:hypothetical protein